jgi:multiple sugar transport system permease protein
MQRSRFVPRPSLAVALVLPAIGLLSLVLFLPIVTAAAASLFRIELLDPSARQFVGLQNYARLFTSAAFWAALRVTLVYTLGTVVGAYALGLASALLLRRRFRGRGLVRTLVILPWAVPQVVAVMVWSWMFDANYGVLNYLLRLSHVIPANLKWLETPGLALAGTVMVTIWCIFPVATVMLLAGLTAIPAELYEAAAVDGAGPLRQFGRITWPALGPVNLLLILMLFLIAFTRVITIIYVMTGGGPSGATETLPIQSYLQAFKFSQLGYGSATGMVVLGLALLASLLWFKALARSSEGLQ